MKKILLLLLALVMVLTSLVGCGAKSKYKNAIENQLDVSLYGKNPMLKTLFQSKYGIL